MIVLVCLEAGRASSASRAALGLAAGLAANAKVVVLVAGGPADSDAFEEARRTDGVERIIHIEDSALAEADFFTLGMVLAEAARLLQAGVVLAGERSDDEGQGLVPAALAYHLHGGIVAHVHGVRCAGPAAEVVEVDAFIGGCRCKVECKLPVVLATAPMPWPRKAQHRRADLALEVMTLAQLDLDASRLVPRPDLLGELERMDGARLGRVSLEQAANAILLPTTRTR